MASSPELMASPCGFAAFRYGFITYPFVRMASPSGFIVALCALTAVPSVLKAVPLVSEGNLSVAVGIFSVSVRLGCQPIKCANVFVLRLFF